MGKMKTTDEFKSEIKDKYGNEYLALEEYKGSCFPINVKHNIPECNHTYKVRPQNLLSGIRLCPKCKKKYGKHNTKKKTTQEFKKFVEESTNFEYTLKSEYINDNTKVKIQHLDHTYMVTPSNFIQGYRCPICSNKLKKDTDIFKRSLPDNYKILSDYTNNKTKILFHHIDCNQTFKMTPNDFQQGHRCPYCNRLIQNVKSKGVRNIESYLDLHNIKYRREVTFDDCKFINKLRFDFVVYNEDDSILTIIEYDGKQHFEPSFSDKDFDLQIQRDKIKNSYCEKKGIPLLRITYQDLNLNDILDNVFNDYYVARKYMAVGE